MPPPLNPPSCHSPDPEPNPKPHSNPPDSPSPSSNPDPNPSEPDDDMSKATKAFNKVMKLEKDGSNWSTWDYDAKDPLTKASLEKRLFSLTCTNPAKAGKHLDNLIAIMDELAEHGVSIPDSQFKLAIISSTPDVYQATIKALITVYREEPNKLTPEMLITAVHAETSSSNKSQESANYCNDNF
ncbi:hypothetical protein D9758_012655 [Tetrapyrgos nigripes]|uniref:Uncharacterized protein n=1 Tax=Tetrapyrgos nigripes TaxID=182062 RepID=A0A8H5GDF8_9AGAR|nr:hypothetical protein D9758_012655 [Tetrapyrgos nigripes]